MASFEVALDWALQFEDSQRQYAKVPDAPPGAFAIAGINSFAWPEEFAIVDALPQDNRAGAVAAFYAAHFWNTWLNQIESDEVAKRVFDAAVNMGGGTAVRLLQSAVNALGGNLAVDGQLGPATVTAVNSVSASALVAEFQSDRAAHYRFIVLNNPSLQRYLAGWLARAQA